MEIMVLCEDPFSDKNNTDNDAVIDDESANSLSVLIDDGNEQTINQLINVICRELKEMEVDGIVDLKLQLLQRVSIPTSSEAVQKERKNKIAYSPLPTDIEFNLFHFLSLFGSAEDSKWDVSKYLFGHPIFSELMGEEKQIGEYKEEDAIQLISSVDSIYEPTDEYGLTIGNLIKYALDVGSLKEILLALLLLFKNSDFNELEISQIRPSLSSFYNLQFADTLVDDYFNMEDEQPPPMRIDNAMTVLAITGASLEVCIKSLEMANDDINNAVNFIFDDSGKISQMIEAANAQKAAKKEKEMQKRIQKMKSVEEFNEKLPSLLMKNILSLDSGELLFDLENIGDGTISNEKIIVLILNKIDHLVAERYSGINLFSQARLPVVFDDSLLSVGIIYLLIESLLNDELPLSDYTKSYSLVMIFRLLKETVQSIALSEFLIEDSSIFSNVTTMLLSNLSFNEKLSGLNDEVSTYIKEISFEIWNIGLTTFLPNPKSRVKLFKELIEKLRKDTSPAIEKQIQILSENMLTDYKLFSTSESDTENLVDSIIAIVSQGMNEKLMDSTKNPYSSLYSALRLMLDIVGVLTIKEKSISPQIGINIALNILSKSSSQIGSVLELLQEGKSEGIEEWIKSSFVGAYLESVCLGLCLYDISSIADSVPNLVNSLLEILEQMNTLLTFEGVFGTDFLHNIIESVAYTASYYAKSLIQYSLSESDSVLSQPLLSGGIEIVDDSTEKFLSDLAEMEGDADELICWIKKNIRQSISLPGTHPAMKHLNKLFNSIFGVFLHHSGLLQEAITISKNLSDQEFRAQDPPMWLTSIWESSVFADISREIIQQKQQLNMREDISPEARSYEGLIQPLIDLVNFLYKFKPACNITGSLNLDSNMSETNLFTAIVAFMKQKNTVESILELIQSETKKCQMRISGLDFFIRLIENSTNDSVLVIFLKQIGSSFCRSGNYYHYLSNLNGISADSKEEIAQNWFDLYGIIGHLLENSNDHLLILPLLTSLRVKIKPSENQFFRDIRIFSSLQNTINRYQPENILAVSGALYHFNPDSIKQSGDLDENAVDCYFAALKVLRLLTTQIVTSLDEKNEDLDKSMFDIIFSELKRSIRNLEVEYNEPIDSDCQQILSSATKFERNQTGLTINEVIEGENEYSIVFWINLSSLSDGNQSVYFRGNNEKYNSIEINSNDKIEFHHSGNYNVQSTTVLQTKQWFHVACIYKEEKIFLYINGTLESSVEAPGKSDNYLSSYPVKIGKGKNESNKFYSGFTGLLSDIKYSKRAFSESELFLLLKEGPRIERSDDYCYELLSILYTVRKSKPAQDILCQESSIKLLATITRNGSLRTQTTCIKLLRNIFKTTPVKDDLQEGIIELLFDIIKNALDFTEKLKRAEHRGEYSYSITLEIIMLFRSLFSNESWRTVLNNWVKKITSKEIQNNFDIFSVLYLIGGTNDVLRVGGRAICGSETTTVISYKFYSGSATVIYDKPNSKPILVDTENLEPIDEIKFSPESLDSYDFINQCMVYSKNPEDNEEDERLFKILVRSSSLCSLNKLLSDGVSFSPSDDLVVILGELASQPIEYRPNVKKLESICHSLWKRLYYLQQNKSFKPTDTDQSLREYSPLLELLQAAFPDMPDSKLLEALRTCDGDIDKALNYITDSDGSVEEVMFKTRGKYPLAWAEKSLAQNNKDVEAAITWLKENQLSLIREEPNLLENETGDDIYIHPFLEKGRTSPLPDQEEIDEIPIDLDIENVRMLLEEFETARSTLYSRQVLVTLLTDPEHESLVQNLMLENMTPQQVSDFVHLLTCRDDNNVESTMERFIKGICISGNGNAESIIDFLVDDCSTHLIRIATTNINILNALNTATVNDYLLLMSPRIKISQWLFTVLLENDVFNIDERLERLYIWMLEVIRSPIMPVKHITFNLMKRLFIHLGANSLPYINRLNLPSLISLAEKRISKERRAGVSYIYSTYITSLLNLLSTIQFLKNQDCKPVEINLDVSDKGSNHLSLSWDHDGENSTYFLEGKIDNEWKSLYQGNTKTFTVKGLSPANEYIFRVKVQDREDEFISNEVVANTHGKTLNNFRVLSSELNSLLIDTDENSITKLEGSNWDCVLLETKLKQNGIYYFEIYIEESGLQQYKNGNIWIGVVDKNSFFSNTPCGWGIMNFRIVKDCPLNKTRTFGDHFGTNNTIGVLVDLDSYTMNFWKDGKDMGNGFLHHLDMKNRELKIVIGLKDPGNKVVLLPGGFEFTSDSCKKVLSDSLICSELLMRRANNEIIPHHILYDMYTSLRKWISNKTRKIRVKGGCLIELDTQSRLLSEFNFLINSIYNTPHGPCKVLGSHGDTIWFLPHSGEIRDALFWNEEQIRSEIFLFSLIEERPTFVSDNYSINYLEFTEHIKREWDMGNYFDIVRTFDKLSSIGHSNISPSLFLTENPVQGSTPLLLSKAAYIRYLNEKANNLLPMGSLRQSENWRLGNLIITWKSLLFYTTKKAFFNDMVYRSQFWPPLPDDEFSDPDHMPQIEIDRTLASSSYYSSDVGKRARKSVFGQLYTKLSGEKRYDWVRLRQHFIGKLDGGQARSFRVTLSNEGVYDYGGPYREVFLQCCTELQSPDILPLLIPTPNQSSQVGAIQDKFLLNPLQNSQLSGRLYGFLGRLIGISLRCEISLPLNFSSVIWKGLVGEVVDVTDLERDDYNFKKLINGIRKSTKEEWEADYKSLITWSVQLRNGTSIDLLPNGSLTPVEWNEREEYLERLVSFKINEGKSQCEFIKEGLGSIIPIEIISVLNWNELELLICGQPYFNVQELKENTVYEGVSENDQHIHYFWKVIEELDISKHEEFLRFAWARSRMPASDTPPIFKIQYPPPGSEDCPDAHLPTAQTCFFSISLPRYTSEEATREKLLYAIENCVDMDNDFHI
eukprot:TRINITY_DN4155_c0_g1_i2.p1 TRINITY_DN4155_c0_g1~~TRINITY_DN4155_c0_g1_i2.p1  ORF type:complete len:2905 (-),score=575.58 TRINITY_DN4155_c0_g1_i2:2-8716(-)